MGEQLFFTGLLFLAVSLLVRLASDDDASKVSVSVKAIFAGLLYGGGALVVVGTFVSIWS